MSRIVQSIVLKSDRHFGRKVLPHPFGEILRTIPGAVRQSVRMAYEGRSRARSKCPDWLAAASDIRFLGHSGEDDTCLQFEAPRLGEAAAKLYEQKQLWPTVPSPDRTGLDLLADVVDEIAGQNAESDKFDSGLLRQICSFQRAFDGAFQEMCFVDRSDPAKFHGVLSSSVISAARSLYSSTPVPRRVRLVGKLDMIRASTQAFALILDDGSEIRGVLTNGDIADLMQLFQQRVAVYGKAVYRPSGHVLRVDADEVTSASIAENFFSSIPGPGQRRLDVRQMFRNQQHRRGLAAIFGKWPGDESDEQIEQALQEMS